MDRTDTHVQLEMLQRELEHQDPPRRITRVAGALAVAASAVLVAVLVTGRGDDSPDSQAPAGRQTAENIQVANDFLDAFGTFDMKRAGTYLAPGAHLTIWSSPRDIDWMARQARWLQATGFTYTPGPCAAGGSTVVVCTFDYHGFGSQRLGRGPFTDTFAFTVEDGHIVDGTLTTPDGTDSFSSQMWDPFAGWMATNHPADAAVMYANWPSMSTQAINDRAIRAWVRMLGRYATAVERGKAY
jgi:hypothetical protein